LKNKLTKLSIFDSFKTKGDKLTGEAIRQRHIISHLAKEENSLLMTRTAISQDIAEKNNTSWKNVYSGVFHDLDEILIPMKIVEEAGRLPLKRGPKALQEKGIPFYNLTSKGFLVALSIDEVKNKTGLLRDFLANEQIMDKELEDSIRILLDISPNFVFSIFENYVKAYCNGKIKELLPFELLRLERILGKNFRIQKELLEGFVSLSTSHRKNILNLLSKFK
jgi:hypothetical protein